jgi:hypothetical protein
VQKQLNIIQMYPAFSVEIWVPTSWLTGVESACWMSAQAAMTDEKTMRPKEKSINGVTEPPNQRTSPYAIKIMVKFLKMVYTGIDRYLIAHVPVYIMPMRRSEMGNPDNC